jgi:hypothetical protein
MLSIGRRDHHRFASRDLTVADFAVVATDHRVFRKQESVMSVSTAIVEIRAAEGGADAKLLVEDQLAMYIRLAGRRSL